MRAAAINLRLLRAYMQRTFAVLVPLVVALASTSCDWAQPTRATTQENRLQRARVQRVSPSGDVLAGIPSLAREPNPGPTRCPKPNLLTGRVLHTFDAPSNRALRPGSQELAATPSDEWSSESPLDNMVLRIDGRGANSSRGYLTVVASDAREFYAESTPYWWTPSRTVDLRLGSVSFFPSEISTITVSNSEYLPRLFLAAYSPNEGYTTIVLREPLRIGPVGTWAFNRIRLTDNASRWIVLRDHWVTTQLSVAEVMCQAGFIGVAYHDLRSAVGVNATGVLGIDEFSFGVP